MMQKKTHKRPPSMTDFPKGALNDIRSELVNSSNALRNSQPQETFAKTSKGFSACKAFRMDMSRTQTLLKPQLKNEVPKLKESYIKPREERKSEEVYVWLEKLILLEDALFEIREKCQELSIPIFERLREYWELMMDNYESDIEMCFDDILVRKAIKAAKILEIKILSIFNYFLFNFLDIQSRIDQQKQANLCRLYTHAFGDLKEMKSILQLVHLNLVLICYKFLNSLSAELLRNNLAEELIENLKSRKCFLIKADEVTNSIKLNNKIVMNFISRYSKAQNEQANFKGMSRKPKIIPEFMALLKYSEGLGLPEFKILVNKFIKEDCKAIFAKASSFYEFLNSRLSLRVQTGEDDREPQEYQTPAAPYLPPLPPEAEGKIYTLVLDLDETLIHYFEDEEKGDFYIRPGAQEFVETMSKYYEVVIFTAAQQDYADWILDQLDPNKFISYRLYRHHATQCGSFYLKDLSKLGRDISKIIIIDNCPENFKEHSENGIFIRTWIGDMTDSALTEISPLLKQIVEKKAKDVRKALNTFRDQILLQLYYGIENPYPNLQLDEN